MSNAAAAQNLNISIVGGGIAGLSAAIALRRAGHVITIYERSDGNNELGAAIHVSPNAARILLDWGLDPVRAEFVVAKKSRIFKGDTLRQLSGTDFDNIAKDYGAPWYYAHRIDLHAELKRLATSTAMPGKPAALCVNTNVIDFNAEEGTITIADGSTITADLVIGADGVHSTAAKAVLGMDKPAVFTGQAAYRFLLPSELLEHDAETKHFLDDDDGRFKIFLGSTGNRIVWYPCRSNRIQNLAGLTYESQVQGIEDWNTGVDLEMLLNEFRDLHPSLQAVMRKATSVKKWPLLYREPILKWFKRKLVIIGDAAHPMLPHQGQAGAQAIEDSAALGIILENLTTAAVDSNPDLLSDRLFLFQTLRGKRVASIQIFSNAGQDQADKTAEAAKPFMDEPIPRNPADFIVYNFAYDVREHASRMLKDEAKV